MNTKDFTSRPNKDFLDHLIDELSASIENDPAALREALAEEGIDQDKLVKDGLQFIRGLQEKQKVQEQLLEPGLNLTRTKKIRGKRAFQWLEFFRLPRYVYAFAALLIIAVISYLIIDPFAMTVIIVDRGEQLERILPDGSRVKFNSESKLTYGKGFNDSHRQVVLVYGEAFWDVQKGKLPFTITAGDANIRVVGTQFNVKSRNEKIEVAVSEGVVEVATGSSAITLNKGQATAFHVGEPPSPPQQAQAEYPAWTQGKLAFYQETLKNVLEELERRFDVIIELRDKQLEETVITAQFESSNLESILSAICQLTNKNYRGQNEVYIIY